MTTERSPLDQALDVMVFAPLGLALEAKDQLPGLIDRGRRHWGSEAGMAKVIGQFAVGKGRREAERLVQRATQLLMEFGLVPTPSPVPDPTADAATAAPGQRRTTAAAPTPAAAAPPTAASTPSAGHLAIPGYDALSAPQVVSRLDGLSGDELEAVRAYEEATRGRKTILGRVAQLQALLS